MRARGELGRTRVPSARTRADANLAQIWSMDWSSWMRRSGCVAPLERAQLARRSGRTRSDTRGRDASSRCSCPYVRLFFFIWTERQGLLEIYLAVRDITGFG
jgi:hypothetical protein